MRLVFRRNRGFGLGVHVSAVSELRVATASLHLGPWVLIAMFRWWL